MSKVRLTESEVEGKARELYDGCRERIARGERCFRELHLFGNAGIKSIDLWGLTKATSKGVVAYQKKVIRPYAIVQLAVAATMLTRVHEMFGQSAPVSGAHLIATMDYRQGAFKAWIGQIDREGPGASTEDPVPICCRARCLMAFRASSAMAIAPLRVERHEGDGHRVA